MIKTLLTTSWEDVLNMDILLKCNNEKHVIQVKSSEFENELESTILVYYNVYNNMPMILVRLFNGAPDCEPEIVDGFTVTKSEVNDDDKDLEHVYVLSDLKQALQE